MDDKPQVKCQECGFLALRHRETHELIGAPQAYRVDTTIPVTPDGKSNHYDGPECFDRAFPLKSEAGGENKTKDSVLAVIKNDRKCGTFIEWDQGSTPREHREMQFRERMMAREDARDREAKDRADRLDAAASKRDDDRDFRANCLHLAEIVIVIAVGALTYFASMNAAKVEADATLNAAMQAHKDFLQQTQQPPPAVTPPAPTESQPSAVSPANAP